ncbi:hypothetical protein ACFYYR_11220 [Streptomyces sp. NPDC001922]|uniref:hypothetical protein n=1 Tax=Streptomyces sp. NPDC001922 TaxID=3364624 RepID=UPI00368DF214
MRKRTLAIPVVGALVTLVVLSNAAYAAGPPGEMDPTGLGGLIPEAVPPPGSGKTLYEAYPDASAWKLDNEFGDWDLIDKFLGGINSLLMAAIVLIGRACVVITQWALLGASVPELNAPITKAVGGAAGALVPTLLPAALVVGALVAYGNNKRANGSALSQIGWLFASGVLAISLLTSPGAWVDGINSARNIGNDVTFSVASAGIGDPGNTPIKMDRPPNFDTVPRCKDDDKSDFCTALVKCQKEVKHAKDKAAREATQARCDKLSEQQPKRVAMMRKAGDAVWRTYVVYPWCLADFGSVEWCQYVGEETLKKSGEERGKYLSKHMNDDDDTDEFAGSKSVDWRQGHIPEGRFGVLLLSMISILIYAVLVLTLAFASIASLLGALMLLIAGVIFACLWVIPGKPRQWGVKWFDALLGMVLQSFVVTLVLACLLIITTVCTQAAGDLGWFVASGLSITAGLVAFKFRRMVETIVGSMSAAGPEAAIGGLLAAKAVGGVAQRARTIGGNVKRNVGRMANDRWDTLARERGGTTAGGASGGSSGPGRGGGLPGGPNKPLPPPGSAPPPLAAGNQRQAQLGRNRGQVAAERPGGPAKGDGRGRSYRQGERGASPVRPPSRKSVPVSVIQPNARLHRSAERTKNKPGAAGPGSPAKAAGKAGDTARSTTARRRPYDAAFRPVVPHRPPQSRQAPPPSRPVQRPRPDSGGRRGPRSGGPQRDDG